jgi:hypothetical protein
MPFGNRRMGPRLRHRKAACRSTLSFSSSGKSSARSNRLLMGNVFRPLHSPIDDAKRNRGSYEAKLARSAQFLRLPIRAGVPSRMASHGNRARARRSAEEYLHYPPDLLSCTHNSGSAKARHVIRTFNVDACVPNSATATFADHPLGSRR